MADLDRIEAIDFVEETFANRSAQNEKRMRHETKERVAAAGTQGAKISKRAHVGHFVRPGVEQDHIRAFQPQFGCRDQQDTHFRGLSEDVRAIKDLVVQGNRKRSEAEFASAFEQLLRGIIKMISRVIEGVNMQIELDPLPPGLLFLLWSRLPHWHNAIRRFRASPVTSLLQTLEARSRERRGLLSAAAYSTFLTALGW